VTQNARSPMVVRRALGMSSLAKAEDCSLLRDSKAATGPAAVVISRLQPVDWCGSCYNTHSCSFCL